MQSKHIEMKKNIIGIVLILMLGYWGSFIGWWGLLVVAAVVGYGLQLHGFQSFISGLLAGGLFFGLYAYFLDYANQSQLSTKMTELLKFDPLIPTIIIGALLGGLGMLTGKYIRDLTLGEQKKDRYRGKYS